IVAALSEIAKYLGEVGELERSEPAAGTVISLRHSARYADERDILPLADERKDGRNVSFLPRARNIHVAGHVVGPQAGAIRPGEIHIGIMVAGHDGDPAGRPEVLEPLGGDNEFGGERDIDEVAGQGDVIGTGGANVGGHCQRYRRIMMEAAVSMPGNRADRALA